MVDGSAINGLDIVITIQWIGYSDHYGLDIVIIIQWIGYSDHNPSIIPAQSISLLA